MSCVISENVEIVNFDNRRWLLVHLDCKHELVIFLLWALNNLHLLFAFFEERKTARFINWLSHFHIFWSLLLY